MKKIYSQITKFIRLVVPKLPSLERSLSLSKRIGGGFLLLLSIGLQAQTVKVAAAANLRYVFEDIDTAYEKANPSVKVEANFGSSGMLYQQIVNGADFDLFMAADNSFPKKLKEQGAASDEMKIYALGKLVLWSNSIDVSTGLDKLTSDVVKRIAIAKPELAPYGDRAIETLKKTGLYEKVKDKLVYADNISQTAQFVQTGNAEVAFLAMSLTLSPEMQGSTFEIMASNYTAVEQGLILVKKWKPNPEAAKFMQFVLSPACKPIFEKHGYVVP